MSDEILPYTTAPPDDVLATHRRRFAMAPDRDPWTQQIGETDRAYGFFCLYRDLGPLRDLNTVADLANRQSTYLRNIMTINKWLKRAKAWDADQERIYAARVAKMRKDMATRHVKMARALQEKALARLATLDTEKIGAHALILMLDTAAKIERMALGLETETGRSTAAVAVSVTTPDDTPGGATRVDVAVLHTQIMDGIDGLVRRMSPEQIAAGYAELAAASDSVAKELETVLPSGEPPAA